MAASEWVCLHDDEATLVQDVDDNENWSQESFIVMAYKQYKTGGLDLLNAPNWLTQGVMYCEYIRAEIESDQWRRANG